MTSSTASSPTTGPTVPAVTQRRHLASMEGPQHDLSRTPSCPTGSSHGDSRSTIGGSRSSTASDHRDQRRAARHRAARALQPAIDAAREAWEPYARPIRDLERELETELRPGDVERQPRRPSGRVRAPTPRRTPRRRRREAVEQAQAAIATIHADGAPRQGAPRPAPTPRRRTAQPGRAHRRDWTPSTATRSASSTRLLDAADTYTGWLEGRPTPTARLAHAVGTLTAVARSAPSFARHAGEVDQTQWYQLLDLTPPLHELERGRPTPEIELGR